jgi:hypothetical protein
MHPTVYDNIKTVIEGTHYDLENDKLINLIDRNDFVNLAKLTRRFELVYSSVVSDNILTKLILSFNTTNWTNEIINSSENEGCSLQIKYYLHDLESLKLTEDNINLLLSKYFWNYRLSIDKIVRFDETFEIFYKITVSFKMKFSESDYDRIIEICTQTYKLLNKLIEEEKKGEIHVK